MEMAYVKRTIQRKKDVALTTKDKVVKHRKIQSFGAVAETLLLVFEQRVSENDVIFIPHKRVIADVLQRQREVTQVLTIRGNP